MANYIVKKKQDFTFAMEENADKVYTLPAIGSLGVDDIVSFQRVSEVKDISEKLKECKSFILRHVPELAESDLGDMEYIGIFTAYANAQNLGE